MTNLPQIFEGSQIRHTTQDEEVWFVAKDICSFFGESNYRRAVSRLDEDEKGVSQINTPGGMQEMTIVNESGLYALLFYMQPEKGNVDNKRIKERLEKIKRFKRWVTHEVLPAIRKTGSYGVADARQLVESAKEPLLRENESLKSKVIALLEEKIERQSEEIKEVKKSKRTKKQPRKMWNRIEKAEVWRLYQSGWMPSRIAPRFGVSNGSIRSLVRNIKKAGDMT